MTFFYYDIYYYVFSLFSVFSRVRELLAIGWLATGTVAPKSRESDNRCGRIGFVKCLATIKETCF